MGSERRHTAIRCFCVIRMMPVYRTVTTSTTYCTGSYLRDVSCGFFSSFQSSFICHAQIVQQSSFLCNTHSSHECPTSLCCPHRHARSSTSPSRGQDAPRHARIRAPLIQSREWRWAKCACGAVMGCGWRSSDPRMMIGYDTAPSSLRPFNVTIQLRPRLFPCHAIELLAAQTYQVRP